MEIITGVLDNFISDGIGKLSMSEVAKTYEETNDNFDVYKDKTFNRKQIAIIKRNSYLVLNHVFTPKECEKLLSLNSKKIKQNNNHVNEYSVKSKELAAIISDRISTIVKYNAKIKHRNVSSKFILSEFIDESYYHVTKGKSHVYIFLNSGFKNGRIYVNGSKYKPITGSVLITNEVCKGEQIKDGYQYVIQGFMLEQEILDNS